MALTPGCQLILFAVSFSPARAHAVRISLTARVGEAVIPAKILSDCYIKPNPTVGTVLRRYEFLFSGRPACYLQSGRSSTG